MKSLIEKKLSNILELTKYAVASAPHVFDQEFGSWMRKKHGIEVVKDGKITEIDVLNAWLEATESLFADLRETCLHSGHADFMLNDKENTHPFIDFDLFCHALPEKCEDYAKFIQQNLLKKESLP